MKTKLILVCLMIGGSFASLAVAQSLPESLTCTYTSENHVGYSVTFKVVPSESSVGTVQLEILGGIANENSSVEKEVLNCIDPGDPEHDGQKVLAVCNNENETDRGQAVEITRIESPAGLWATVYRKTMLGARAVADFTCSK